MLNLNIQEKNIKIIKDVKISFDGKSMRVGIPKEIVDFCNIKKNQKFRFIVTEDSKKETLLLWSVIK